MSFELGTFHLQCSCTNHYSTKSSYFLNHPECFILLQPNTTLKLIKNCINAQIELLFNYCNIKTMETYFNLTTLFASMIRVASKVKRKKILPGRKETREVSRSQQIFPEDNQVTKFLVLPAQIALLFLNSLHSCRQPSCCKISHSIDVFTSLAVGRSQEFQLTGSISLLFSHIH